MLLRGFLVLAAVVAGAVGFAGCTPHSVEPTANTQTAGNSTAEPAKVLTQDELVAKGHKLYISNCLSCHGGDPKVDGPVGPSIAGSSAELIHDRVLFLKYPESYKPKRTTAMMVAFPQLEKDLPALTAYLQAP